MFCKNRHEIDITIIILYCSLVGLNTSIIIQEKTMEFSMLHRYLIFSFVYLYNRQVLLLLMICIYVLS